MHKIIHQTLIFILDVNNNNLKSKWAVLCQNELQCGPDLMHIVKFGCMRSNQGILIQNILQTEYTIIESGLTGLMSLFREAMKSLLLICSI